MCGLKGVMGCDMSKRFELFSSLKFKESALLQGCLNASHLYGD
jgi:hypothetical protein